MINGFDENVINDNNNDDDEDDYNDNNNNKNNNNDNNDNWVIIDYEGMSTKVPLSNNCITFGEIKKYLISQDELNNSSNFEITESHFIVDVDADHEYQDDDDALMLANNKKLVIRWNAFFINICDGNDFQVDIRVAQDWKIERIKKQIKKQHNVFLEKLSKDGTELENDKILRDYGIYENGHTLVSRICLQIKDNICELVTDILVCEFWSINDVLEVYLNTTGRSKHCNAKLLLNGDSLDFNSKVYDYKITNQSNLEYYAGKYNVLVYDSDNNISHMQQQNDMQAIKIEVMDNQTIKEIQESYARLTRKPFMKNDKLLSNERQLEDNVQLFRLRIKDDEPLIIEREQQQKPSQYICAECGSIVSLRPYDAVQCRECFHQIVYKKRTQRICQYNCR